MRAEYERRLKALQQEVTEAYLKGYSEARDRAQWNLDAAYSENERLRLALETAWAENAVGPRQDGVLAIPAWLSAAC
jgi:hypothetical protein